MSSASWRETVERFVEVASEIEGHLDFAAEIPDPPLPLSPRVRVLECLWWDLRATVAAAGRDGARMFQAATVARDEIAAAVDAHDQERNLAPWVACRDSVREQLDRLRSMMPTDPVSKVAPPQAVPAPPASPPQPPDTAGDKGKEGERVRTDPATATVEEIAKTLDPTERRILKAMRSVHPDVLTAESIVEEILDGQGVELTLGKVRRPMERLKSRHLTAPGQGRGTPLTPLGIEVADAL